MRTAKTSPWPHFLPSKAEIPTREPKTPLRAAKRPHNARHTSAAFLFDQGEDDRLIMEILGVDPKTFPHYKRSITTSLTDQAMKRMKRAMG